MLTKRFDQLFSSNILLEYLEYYREERDYPLIKSSIRSGKFIQILSKGYVPDPLVGFDIPKSNGERRGLVKASIASKIVQKCIAHALGDAINLNDKSYAFRKGKGTLKAIGRTSDFLRTYPYVAKGDIDNFFDTINQEKLMLLLKRIIVDPKILSLIALFLKNGMLKSHQWVDKHQGIYQGDSLSPLLSNIYLHPFDMALERRGITFVRFADDMLFFAQTKEESKEILNTAQALLSTLDLSLGEEKSYLSSRAKGFEFLGLFFREKSILMDRDRLLKKLTLLSEKSRKKSLEERVAFFNTYLVNIKRYYLKLLTTNHQLVLIDEHIDAILIHKIIQDKQTKIINNKSKFVQILTELNDLEHHTTQERVLHAKALVAKAYEAIALANPMDTATKTIAKKKSSFLKDEIKSSEIILNGFGLYVTLSRGKVIVKEYGKVVKSLPLNWLTRIVVMTKRASLSTALIYECSRRKVDIDFIEKQQPYAQITYYTTISHALHLKQMEIKKTHKGFKIAKSLIKAKIKNQINLIKYHARYREKHNTGEFEQLQQAITLMEKIYSRCSSAKKIPTLMGFEGSASVAYWGAFGLLIGVESFHRETHNAPDSINQALNYGYAFIYHRMQSALQKTGVNIYHSFLHTTQANKPTLVFDMVEPFRQPVVDREIISILNRGTPIASSKGRLTQKSIKVITQHIQERLATPTRWRKGKYKILTIIEEQALELAHVIGGTKSRYKAFVVRY